MCMGAGTSFLGFLLLLIIQGFSIYSGTSVGSSVFFLIMVFICLDGPAVSVEV